MKAADALRAAAIRLTCVSDSPRLDAELLMAHALSLRREELILRLDRLDEPAEFSALVERRLTYEPVSHITGKRDFWTLTLAVTPDVLTPRPDSETLIEAAVDHFRDGPPPRRILDLGTGSGALLLAALDQWRGASGVGIDISATALEVARANAESCGIGARAVFIVGDWMSGIVEPFELILANPPYISTLMPLPPDVYNHEPHLALFAGEDGLDAYREIAPGLSDVLTPQGVALFEIGFDQRQSATQIFENAGFVVGVRNDLAGLARCLMVTRRP